MCSDPWSRFQIQQQSSVQGTVSGAPRLNEISIRFLANCAILGWLIPFVKLRLFHMKNLGQYLGCFFSLQELIAWSLLAVVPRSQSVVWLARWLLPPRCYLWLQMPIARRRFCHTAIGIRCPTPFLDGPLESRWTSINLLRGCGQGLGELLISVVNTLNPDAGECQVNLIENSTGFLVIIEKTELHFPDSIRTKS